MGPETQHGHSARIDRLERDEREARERRDFIQREQAAEHRRIWEAIETNRERLTRLETQAVERHREIREDIGDCSNKVLMAEGRLTGKVNEAEARLERELGVLRGEVRKQREGTLTQKVAYIGAAGAVIAAAFIAVAQVLSALGGG